MLKVTVVEVELRLASIAPISPDADVTDTVGLIIEVPTLCDTTPDPPTLSVMVPVPVTFAFIARFPLLPDVDVKSTLMAEIGAEIVMFPALESWSALPAEDALSETLPALLI